MFDVQSPRKSRFPFRFVLSLLSLPHRSQLTAGMHKLHNRFLYEARARFDRVEQFIRLAAAGVDDVVFYEDHDQIAFLETSGGQPFPHVQVEVGSERSFLIRARFRGEGWRVRRGRARAFSRARVGCSCSGKHLNGTQTSSECFAEQAARQSGYCKPGGSLEQSGYCKPDS